MHEGQETPRLCWDPRLAEGAREQSEANHENSEFVLNPRSLEKFFFALLVLLILLFVRFVDIFDCCKQNKREGELKESRVEILREKKIRKESLE